MQEIYQFRVCKKHVGLLFSRGEYIDLGGNVCDVRLNADDPRISQVQIMQREIKDASQPFYFSASVRREYSESELERAEHFVLLLDSFYPNGQECGTVYDFSEACSECSAGYIQKSSLLLFTTELARKDILRSFAGEIIVSNKLAELLRQSAYTGFEINPILNPRSMKPSSNWGQFVVCESEMEISELTRTGIKLFDEDPFDKYRCSKGRAGHRIGLNRLSELWLNPLFKMQKDVSFTREYLGNNVGVFLPAPEIVVSSRFRRLLIDSKIKGCKFEVARFEQ